MISKIKNYIKKYKSYREEKKHQEELMHTIFPTRLIFLGSYQKPLEIDGVKINVKYEDAFLLDQETNPHTAVRLTGDNPNFQTIPIESCEKSLADDDSYLYIDDNGEPYVIHSSFLSHPDFHSHYITLENLISEMDIRNKTNLAIAKELSEQESMGLSVEK